MSLNCDGGDIAPINYSKTDEQYPDESQNLAEEDTSFEDEFRGFEKVPLVVLRRHDISPYVATKGTENSEHESCISSPKHLSRLMQVCRVNLTRDDLYARKVAIKYESSGKFSDSDSESESEIDMSTAMKCKICDKVYSSLRKLNKHQNKKHMIVYENKSQKRVSFSDHVIIHEVKEYHKCRKCPKIFENYKSLKTHMKRYHKKRKCYICHYCNKNFVDRMFFKVHIKLHCDMCGLYLQNKAKFYEHRRTVCRTFKLHPCKTCNESYFRFMDLKDHSYEHLGTFFVCDICKDQFLTKCAVSHHISFLHSQKRPVSLYGMRNLGTERLYLCNFCEESSVDKDIIESHVNLLPDLTNRAMTGYKDYYFCDQCLRKFDTETDMLQHKWTHFLKTSDNSQERPKIKTKYSINEEIPDHLKPMVILKKLDIDERFLKQVNSDSDYINVYNWEAKPSPVRRPKKTIISNHQCETCGKYFSSSYCLKRHIETQHLDYENLRCKVCEETFVWPSLLRTHKCIRLNIPEMPFEDARPEIHFDNELSQNGFDDLNIEESDDYMHVVDFEVPAPIVQIDDGVCVYNNGIESSQLDKSYGSLNSLGYKLVMQEVPIEF